MPTPLRRALDHPPPNHRDLDADDWISTKVRDVINAQMQTFANAVRRGQA